MADPAALKVVEKSNVTCTRAEQGKIMADTVNVQAIAPRREHIVGIDRHSNPNRQ